MKGSYKTSLAGIGTIVAGATAIFHMAQTKTYDSAQLTTAIGLIVAGLTGLFARDNSVSSEEVGATPQQKAAVQAAHNAAIAAIAPPTIAVVPPSKTP